MEGTPHMLHMSKSTLTVRVSWAYTLCPTNILKVKVLLGSMDAGEAQLA